MRHAPSVLLLALFACGNSPPPNTMPPPTLAAPPVTAARVAVAAPAIDDAESAAPTPAQLTSRAVPLPGATGPVTLDYLVYDAPRSRVWVPVGDTGSADVFDVATGTFTRVDGFKTAEREIRGKKRMMGPSAVTVGDGVVYIGNRATSEVCAVDAKTLKLGACLKLPVPTDGVAYVAATKEVWVTTPKDHSLTVLDASEPGALKAKLVIKTDGEVEGYAVDLAHGVFYTNLEDKNRTLVVDITTHAVKANWSTGCNDAGPRGVAFDGARNFVFVACTDGLRVLDAAHEGAPLGKIDTGAGVDNIEYLDGPRLLFAAAGKVSRLTVARVGDKGELTVVATGVTAEGARNAVVDAAGNAYVGDPQTARLLIVAAPPASSSGN